MSVCKPWLWPYAPSSRRPLDHIWARQSWGYKWGMDSVGLGVGSSLSFSQSLGDSCPENALKNHHASIGHSCGSLTSSREHAASERRVWWWSTDAGCCWSTCSPALGLEPLGASKYWMMRVHLRAWLFDRQCGYKSNSESRHMNARCLSVFIVPLAGVLSWIYTHIADSDYLWLKVHSTCRGPGPGF